jgi:hypothetical protein
MSLVPILVELEHPCSTETRSLSRDAATISDRDSANALNDSASFVHPFFSAMGCRAPGLVPVMRLAQACGLDALLAKLVRIGTSIGSNPAGKISAIVAGMVIGADSIDDLDVLRHGGMPALFGGCYAPSTLGSFLREFTFGHVCQLGAACRFLLHLAKATPLLPGIEQITDVDVDSLLRRIYGKAKQGRGVRARQGRRAAVRTVTRWSRPCPPRWRLR